MFDLISGDRILRRIAGRRSFTHIFEINAICFGEYEAEDVTIPCHGNFEGTV